MNETQQKANSIPAGESPHTAEDWQLLLCDAPGVPVEYWQLPEEELITAISKQK